MRLLAPALVLAPAMLFAVALLALSPAAASAQDVRRLERVEWAQVSIHQRIIIRTPRRARRIMRERARRDPLERPVWSERKAPRCVPLASLTGVAVSHGGDVDMMMVDGRRLRAKLDRDCPALNFYAGFYLEPNRDGLICGGRDVLRARSGAACPIARFRRLEARN